MDYRTLMDGISHSGEIPKGEASLITQDSRKAELGAVFVCIAGETVDGHNFAQKARAAGAGMIIAERHLGLINEVVVADTKETYATLCQRFFGNPAQKLTLVAVTGTNGKTTVSTVLKQVLEMGGVSCGLIGSVSSEIAGMEIPAKFTTPEAWDVAALMSRMVKAGCTHLVMEASSQGLAQMRLFGLKFALAVFTNLTQDHLDAHGDMEKYFKAKSLLFRQSEAMLVNCDDEWGRRLLDESNCKRKYTYSARESSADFTAHGIVLRSGGVKFGFLASRQLHPVMFPMPGEYSVYNALAVGGAAVLLGLDEARVAGYLGAVKGVRGRGEVLYNGSCTILRDFAHTGDAIDKLLGALRPYVHNRMVVLFGCAGERDAAKRPAMSKAAATWGDVIYLTSDNPRGEDPEKIFEDALPALEASGKPLYTFIDREEAIHSALEALREGDTLVLCGKGHEDYQVLDGRTVYLDERQLVEEWLRKKESI